MHRIPVSSEGITQVGYHQDTETYGTLELKFASGSVFQFFNVPNKTYDEFMHASSKEDYYVSNIGKRFPCLRV
jgi:ATP-dependent DNA helicase RecG